MSKHSLILRRSEVAHSYALVIEFPEGRTRL